VLNGSSRIWIEIPGHGDGLLKFRFAEERKTILIFLREAKSQQPVGTPT
jgi:hypothetical protein